MSVKMPIYLQDLLDVPEHPEKALKLFRLI
jgi:hypothetical protein